MRATHTAIERALTALRREVVAGLTAAGWTDRALGGQPIATLTRTLPSGIMATAEVHRHSFGLPVDWPIEITLRIGAGYEPALDLMPLLTLEPEVTVVERPTTADKPGFAVHLAQEVAPAAVKILDLVGRHAVAFAETFAGPADLEADTRLRLVVLAASGRHDEARELLAGHPLQEPEDRRFVRQLTRWLDAGGPPAPPLAETLARLPARPERMRFDWSEARVTTRANARSRRAAIDAVQARSAGRSAEELTSLVTAEYAARGVVRSPSEIAMEARRLAMLRQPFGRQRFGWEIMRAVFGGEDGLHPLRTAGAPNPAWLCPPDRATYPIRMIRPRFAAVALDPDTDAWLAAALAHARRRRGPYRMVDVWFTGTGPDAVAHIGRRRVGTVATPEPYAGALRAAALFDEDPFVEARMVRPPGHRAVMLEVPAS